MTRAQVYVAPSKNAQTKNVPSAYDLRNSAYECVQDLDVYLELMRLKK